MTAPDLQRARDVMERGGSIRQLVDAAQDLCGASWDAPDNPERHALLLQALRQAHGIAEIQFGDSTSDVKGDE